MKRLVTFLLCLLAACALSAWDVNVNLTIYNNGNTTAGISEYAYSLQPNSGGASTYYGIGVTGVTVPPNGSTTITADLNWPVNTIPGTGNVMVWWSGGTNSGTVQGGSVNWPGGTTMFVSGSFTILPMTNAPCMSNLVFSAVNNLGVWQIYAVVDGNSGGGSVPSPLPGSEQMVAPGQTYNFTAMLPCSDSTNTTIWATGSNGDDALHDTGQLANGVNPGGNSGSNTNSNSGGVSGSLNPGSISPYSGSNSPAINPVTPVTNILWGANTTTGDNSAVVNAVKQGAQSLLAGANANASQAHADAVAIKNAVNALPSELATNSSNNNLTLTNYATQTTLQGIATTLSSSITIIFL